jgi:CRISPR-associated protein Cmr3
MILFLQPNETFFFRDGRPFTKGQQSEGYSIFPPLPSTLLGALRTAYIAEYGDLPSFYGGTMADTIGTPALDSLGSMHIRGVFLAHKNSEVYFPNPLDLVVKKEEYERGDNWLYPLRPHVPNSTFRLKAASDSLLMWTGSEDVEPETGGKLGNIDITAYFLGRKQKFGFKRQEDFVDGEPKIGIERNRKTLTSEESMLYRINMSRFKSRFLNPNHRNALPELGFVVDYHCTEDLPANGILKLGGEGKSFIYGKSRHNPNPLSIADIETLKVAIQASGIFKLYFATPAIFKCGWLPEWIDAQSRRGQYPLSSAGSIPLELVTAAVGKPITIGGWDMKAGSAKRAYRAIPAGSVYYFKLLDSVRVDDLIKTFHYQNISDWRAAEGFGLCFVGVAEGGTQ